MVLFWSVWAQRAFFADIQKMRSFESVISFSVGTTYIKKKVANISSKDTIRKKI